MDLQDPTEDRSIKRMRSESASKTSAPLIENTTFDDADDLYDTPAVRSDAAQMTSQVEHNHVNITPSPPRSASSVIPGLGMLSSEPPQIETETSVSMEASAQTFSTLVTPSESMEVAAQSSPTLNTASASINTASEDKDASPGSSQETVGCEQVVIKEEPLRPIKTEPFESVLPQSGRHTSDLDFIAAAIANHGNPGAEFEYDSDPDLSSDTSHSEPDSDDSEQEGYELLDPEELARVLMRGEGSEEKHGGVGSQPRTTNELPDERVPKPDITVTPEMKISELGLVHQIVGPHIVVKGISSAEKSVLERGSVLCLADRTVIGAVQEPMGSTHEPYYQVSFTSSDEITELGIDKGTQIFYVEAHAVVLITPAIKALKYTDASNVHDEEVDEDEMEFSDDEAEAEHKRKLKAEKAAKRDTKYGTNVGRDIATYGPARPASYVKPEYPSQAMNYDDEEQADEELYTPLPRPTNLHQMNAAPPPSRFFGGAPDRGGSPNRGRGGARGNFRGSGRGRGRRGSENRDDYLRGDRRGSQSRDDYIPAGRGGRGGDRNENRGYRNESRGGRGRGGFHDNVKQERQQQANIPAPHPSEPTPNHVAAQHPQGHTGLSNNNNNNWMGGAYNHHASLAQQFFASHSNNYNHGGYPFPPPVASSAFIPAGAHVNPTFFDGPATSLSPFTAPPPPSYGYHQYQQYPQANYNNYYNYQPQHFGNVNPQFNQTNHHTHQNIGHQQQVVQTPNMNQNVGNQQQVVQNPHGSLNSATHDASGPTVGANDAIRAISDQFNNPSAPNNSGAS